MACHAPYVVHGGTDGTRTVGLSSPESPTLLRDRRLSLQQKTRLLTLLFLNGGTDGTRTRDLLRDRQAF